MRMDKEREAVIISFLDIYDSLHVAMNAAGGTGFNVRQLKEMTALEMLGMLAGNGITFCHASMYPAEPS